MKTRLPVSRNYVDTSPFGNEIATDVLVSMINGQMKSSQSVPVSCVNFQSFYIEQSFDDLSITVLGSKVKRRITSICLSIYLTSILDSLFGLAPFFNKLSKASNELYLLETSQTSKFYCRLGPALKKMMRIRQIKKRAYGNIADIF